MSGFGARWLSRIGIGRSSASFGLGTVPPDPPAVTATGGTHSFVARWLSRVGLARGGVSFGLLAVPGGAAIVAPPIPGCVHVCFVPTATVDVTFEGC